MEELYEEVDDIKNAMEELKFECREKTEIVERLKYAHNEQLVKVHEAKMEMQKLMQKLDEKAEEILITRKSCEDMKSKLEEKDSIIKNLSSINDQLRTRYDEKLQDVEGENRTLLSDLEKSMTITKEQGEKICAYEEELERVKKLLIASQKKCCEAEERALARAELRKRDDMLLKLEQENREVCSQLKWKKEQFEHLEEAHQKIQNQFQVCRNERELEKSKLIDDISSLQADLEAKTKVFESIFWQLELCNEALIREENKRKLLENELNEFRRRCEYVSGEFEETKPTIEILSNKRDKEIATPRNKIFGKHSLLKEIEFKLRHLEQDKRELNDAQKEFQVAQVNISRELLNISKKFKNMEQIHKDCTLNLKNKESEWKEQMEKTQKELNDCRSEIDCKDQQIRSLQLDLKSRDIEIANLKLQEEEARKKFAAMKSELLIDNSNVEMDGCITKNAEKISQLSEKLNEKSNSQQEEESQGQKVKVALLTDRLESSQISGQQCLSMQKNIEYKEMLEQSSLLVSPLKMEVDQRKNALKDDTRKTSDELDRINVELVDRDKNIVDVQFEMENWKFVSDRLERNNLNVEATLMPSREINQNLQRIQEIEAARLALVEEKDGLLQNMKSRDEIIESIVERMIMRDQEKHELLETIREKDKKLFDLEGKIEYLERESIKAFIEICLYAKLDAEESFDLEKNELLLIAKDQERCLRALREKINLFDTECKKSINSAFNSKLSEQKLRIEALNKAWEKCSEALILVSHEAEGGNLFISELGEELSSLKNKLEIEEKISFKAKLAIERLEAELNEKQLEKEWTLNKFESQVAELEADLKLSNENVKKLMLENEELVSRVSEVKSNEIILEKQITDLKSSLKSSHDRETCFASERERLLRRMDTICNRIGEFSVQDLKLMESLDNMISTFENREDPHPVFISDEKDGMKNPFFLPTNKMMSILGNEDSGLVFISGEQDGKRNVFLPAKTKSMDTGEKIRSPLKEFNSEL